MERDTMWSQREVVKENMFMYGYKTKSTRIKNLNIHNKTKTIKACEKKGILGYC